MNIKVKQDYQYPENISVIVDGVCNHFSTELEDMEFDTDSWWADAGRYVPDDTKIETVISCTKCKAWKNDEDDDWNGIQLWPMI